MKAFIVENHNEALPFIYQSIGRKLLPVSGNLLLHFDSHPDLLLPDIPADSVFDKETLYDAISIESWLLPAVYAGHFSHIVWAKPWWASQIAPGLHQFTVGKHRKTGRIRVTSTLSYFVGEALYAHDSDLTDKKSVKLYVVDVTQLCKLLNKDNKQNTTQKGEKSDCCLESHGMSVKRQRLDSDSKSEVQSEGNCDKNLLEKEGNLSSENSEKDDTKCGLTSQDSLVEAKSCEGYSNFPNMQKLNSEPSMQVKMKEINHKTVEDECTVIESADLQTIGLWEEIQGLLDLKPFVLDIDLDFFSTMDPFREMFTESQYELLKMIYRFEGPKDSSVKSVGEAVTRREEQLSQLKSVFQRLHRGQSVDYTQVQNGDTIHQLVDSLTQSTPDSIDFDWLHTIGSGCDDTELPHHVSTEREIQELTDDVTRLLRQLPKPTLVTLARSSEDDYCPVDQVEGIQVGVVGMLEALYSDVVIIREYTKQQEEKTQ